MRRLGFGRVRSGAGPPAGLPPADRAADSSAAGQEADSASPRSRAVTVTGVLIVAVAIIIATVLPRDARYAFLDLRHDAQFVMRPLRSDSYSFSADGVSFAAAIIFEMLGTSMLIMIIIGWLEQRRRHRMPSRSDGRAAAARADDRTIPSRSHEPAVSSGSGRRAVASREPPSRVR